MLKDVLVLIQVTGNIQLTHGSLFMVHTQQPHSSRSMFMPWPLAVLTHVAEMDTSCLSYASYSRFTGSDPHTGCYLLFLNHVQFSPHCSQFEHSLPFAILISYSAQLRTSNWSEKPLPSLCTSHGLHMICPWSTIYGLRIVNHTLLLLEAVLSFQHLIHLCHTQQPCVNRSLFTIHGVYTRLCGLLSVCIHTSHSQLHLSRVTYCLLTNHYTWCTHKIPLTILSSCVYNSITDTSSATYTLLKTHYSWVSHSIYMVLHWIYWLALHSVQHLLLAAQILFSLQPLSDSWLTEQWNILVVGTTWPAHVSLFKLTIQQTSEA